MVISILPLHHIPIIKESDDIGKIIVNALNLSKITIEEGDIIVVSSTIVSKAEGALLDLNTIKPSERALELADASGKDPRLCEAILRSSRSIIKVGVGPIIAETKHGFICASAGIDTSNVAGNVNIVCTLPVDPDASARKIKEVIETATGKRIAVLLSDTQGRPFRAGAVGVTVGMSGIDPFWFYKGERDLYDYELKSSVIARADEVASAADMVMGQANEGIPVVIVRGVRYQVSEVPATTYNREKEKDLFR